MYYHIVYIISVYAVHPLITLTNNLRLDHNLNPLKNNITLANAAQLLANHLCNTHKLSHSLDNTTSSDIKDRLLRFGYIGTDIGENIAKGKSTPHEVFKVWMNSPEHQKNLLGKYEETGIGTCDSSGEKYFVMVYGTRRGDVIADSDNIDKKKLGSDDKMQKYMDENADLSFAKQVEPGSEKDAPIDAIKQNDPSEANQDETNDNMYEGFKKMIVDIIRRLKDENQLTVPKDTPNEEKPNKSTNKSVEENGLSKSNLNDDNIQGGNPMSNRRGIEQNNDKIDRHGLYESEEPYRNVGPQLYGDYKDKDPLYKPKSENDSTARKILDILEDLTDKIKESPAKLQDNKLSRYEITKSDNPNPESYSTQITQNESKISTLPSISVETIYLTHTLSTSTSANTISPSTMIPLAEINNSTSLQKSIFSEPSSIFDDIFITQVGKGLDQKSIQPSTISGISTSFATQDIKTPSEYYSSKPISSLLSSIQKNSSRLTTSNITSVSSILSSLPKSMASSFSQPSEQDKNFTQIINSIRSNTFSLSPSVITLGNLLSKIESNTPMTLTISKSEHSKAPFFESESKIYDLKNEYRIEETINELRRILMDNNNYRDIKIVVTSKGKKDNIEIGDPIHSIV